MNFLRCSTMLLVCLLCNLCRAEGLRLPSVFGDHMVLQRDGLVPVWGWTDPGRGVRVRIGEAEASAVAYFMGAKLRAELGVPVGLIHSSFGGSPAEAWMPLETLRADADFVPLVERADEKWAAFKPTWEAWLAEKVDA